MKLKYNDFIKSVSVLITGTFIAQFISILASPFIARIYGPEENAYLGLFLKISTLIATVATARLEFVLPIEKKKHYAFGIYQFSLFLSVLISAACLFFIVVYGLIFWKDITINEFVFLLTIPIGISIIAFYNLGNNWELRHENYKSISKANVLLAVFSNAIKFLGVFFNGNFLILIFATIVGYCIASFSFLKRFLQKFKVKHLSYKSKRTRVLVKQNQDFYTYNLFHVLVDLSRDMLIASFIWIYFSKMDFGSYEFSFRMMKLPVVFIGVALSQVFFRKAKDLVSNRNELMRMTSRTLGFTFLIGIFPFGILFFFGSELFSFVFGEKWTHAGKIAELISPWLFLSFLFAPISYIPVLLNKQKTYFWINLVALLILIATFIVSFVTKLSFENGIIILTILQAILLFGLILWFLFQIKTVKLGRSE